MNAGFSSKKRCATLMAGSQIAAVQGARPDHVQVESSRWRCPRASLSFVRPRASLSFDQRHVTSSPPISLVCIPL